MSSASASKVPRCQTAADKPSLRKTNFHGRCHGSPIFRCLEDTIFRRVQLRAGVTVWGGMDRALHSLYASPSHQWQQTEWKLSKSSICGFGKCFCGADVNATPAFTSAAAAESKYLQRQSIPQAYRLRFPHLSRQSMCVFMQMTW